MKTEDITGAVLKQLTLSCTECDIISLVIDTPSFVCFPESPTSVTYRARLLGTSETDSGLLISLIEEWVSGEASIIVTGVLMTVDSECPVAISFLSEGECNSSTSNGSDTGAIIAGVAVIILIISITIIIVAVVALIMKHRHEDLFTKK